MLEPKSLSLAFDTNIWISFSIGKRMDKLKLIFLDHRFGIFICPEIIEEYIRIAHSDKLAKYISLQRIKDTLDIIETFTKSIKVKTVKSISRDPNDDFLLAFSEENKLDFLITGDKDLLVIKQYYSTRILTFGEFISEMY